MILQFRAGKPTVSVFRDTYRGGETIEERKGMIERLLITTGEEGNMRMGQVLGASRVLVRCIH